MTLLEPSPYDDVTRPPNFPGGYNAVLLKYGEFVRNLAQAGELRIADANAPVVSLLGAVNKASPDLARTLIPDRVHPNAGVHLIMAKALLQSWNAPALVTTVEIDGSTAEVIKAENTTVDSVSSAGALAWNQTDKSLPFELESEDPTISAALQWSDVTEALNVEELKVTGLTNPRYKLQIDDDVIDTFSAAQLASGINLATLPTPMSRQARSVLDLTYRHNHLHFARLRILEDALKPYSLKKLSPAMEALDALEQEVVLLQRATAIPKLHRYRLSEAPSQ